MTPSTQPRSVQTASREALLLQTVAHFNAGDLDAVLERLHPDVEWPDLASDQLMRGRDAVRAYWERQMRALRPELTPNEVVPAGDDVIMVNTQRAFERGNGNEMVPAMVVAHRYSFRDGLICRMRHFRSLEAALAIDDA